MRLNKIRYILVLFTLFSIFGTASSRAFGQIDYKEGFKNLEREISEHLTNNHLGRIKQSTHFFIMISIGRRGKIRDIQSLGSSDTVILRGLLDIIKKTNGKWKNDLKKEVVVAIPIILEYDNSDNSKCKIESSEINAVLYDNKTDRMVYKMPLIRLVFYPTIK